MDYRFYTDRGLGSVESNFKPEGEKLLPNGEARGRGIFLPEGLEFESEIPPFVTKIKI